MGILELVFPRICVECGKEGRYICVSCQRQLTTTDLICPMCNQLSMGGWTHGECLSEEGIERLISGFTYKGMVQKCLKKVKYKSSWEIVKFLYQISMLPKLDGGVVVSVPMWREKERVRGFNQSELIARELAKDNKIEYVELLQRIRATEPMYDLNKEQRQKNVEGAFVVNDNLRNRVEGGRVFLVDDVWTSGATMRECSKLIKSVGAKEIWAITLAR